jgi:hypothetical protein
VNQSTNQKDFKEDFKMALKGGNSPALSLVAAIRQKKINVTTGKFSAGNNYKHYFLSVDNMSSY